jgi:hypothetical protein
LTRLSRTLNRIRDRHRDRSLIRLVARPAVLGTVALVAIVAVAVAACSGGSSGSGSSSSSSSSASESSSFTKCLEQHGVTPPKGGAGGAGGGSGTPHARPTGSAASSFRTAMQACRGSSGFKPGSGG